MNAQKGKKGKYIVISFIDLSSKEHSSKQIMKEVNGHRCLITFALNLVKKGPTTYTNMICKANDVIAEEQ